MRNFMSCTLGLGLVIGGALATWAYAAGTPPEPATSPSSVAAEPDQLGRRLRDLGYASLPIDRPRAGYLTIEAEVAGRRLRLIVDTGAPCSILDQDRTAALNLVWQERRVEAARGFDLWDLNTRCV